MWSLNYSQEKDNTSNQSPTVASSSGPKSEDIHSTPCEIRPNESESAFFPDSFSPPLPQASSSTTTTTDTLTNQNSSMQRSSMLSSMQSESDAASPIGPDVKATFFNPGNGDADECNAIEQSVDSETCQSPQTTGRSTSVTTSTGPDLDDFVFIESSQVEKYENKNVLKPGLFYPNQTKSLWHL